jgi:hypothetical protein
MEVCMKFQPHPYHLVEPSPWPLAASIGLLTTTVSAVCLFHGYGHGGVFLTIGLLAVLSTMGLWWADVIREGTFLGHHTIRVQQGLILGIILFIVSEVFFFLSIFWAFFDSALAPTVELGCSWPPAGIQPIEPWELPLVNTVLLLSSGVCLKCGKSDLFMLSSLLPFSRPRVPSTKRIGPHNYEIICILIGSLLGDGSMEKDGNGSRFAFYQEKTNGEYLLWLHQVISSLGYCKPEIPVIQTRKGTNGQIHYIYRFRTYTYSSFNWIYEQFYPNKRKVVPQIIDQYLSPLALAVWIMDDATLHKNKGLRFCTKCFTLKEIQYLASVLQKKYTLNTSIYKTGVVNQYGLYIPKSSMADLTKIVKPYIHPTMLYKLPSI